MENYDVRKGTLVTHIKAEATIMEAFTGEEASMTTKMLYTAAHHKLQKSAFLVGGGEGKGHFCEAVFKVCLEDFVETERGTAVCQVVRSKPMLRLATTTKTVKATLKKWRCNWVVKTAAALSVRKPFFWKGQLLVPLKTCEESCSICPFHWIEASRTYCSLKNKAVYLCATFMSLLQILSPSNNWNNGQSCECWISKLQLWIVYAVSGAPMHLWKLWVRSKSQWEGWCKLA